MLLEGRNAIVTGGSQGIGAAASMELAREGANVCLAYRRDEEEAKRAAKVGQEIQKLGRKTLEIQCDVSKFDEAERVVQQVLGEFGRVDILVNNAGMNWDAVSWKMSEE